MQQLDGIHSSYAERRMSSVIALGEVGELGDKSDVAIKELILLLSDDSTPVKDVEWPRSVGVEAANTLAKIGGKSIRPLLDALQNENHRVRLLAAMALGEIQDPSAVVGLNKVLMNDPNLYVQGNAAQALGEIGDNSALPGLQEALKDKDTTVVIAAISAIAAIGNPTMIERLTPLLNSDNEQIAEFAKEALEKLREE